MTAITLKDIGLAQYDAESLPLLTNLRQELLKQKPQVCIERARYVTEYFKNISSYRDPMSVRFAKAVKHYLSNKEPLFFDDSLIAGTTTSKPFGAPVYPEWTGMTIWPELDVISTRDKNPMGLTRKEADELNFEIYPYWMENNILEYTRKKYDNPECLRLMERIVFFIGSKAGTISHTVPYYEGALKLGLDGIVEQAEIRQERLRKRGSLSAEEQERYDFYEAVKIAMQGVAEYAKNLSRKADRLAGKERDPGRKANFEEMARICAKVPAKPSETFREALNAIWIVQVAIHAESINMAMSPGRLDKILYEYYRHDIDSGALTVKHALELLGCFWLKLNDNTNLVPETAEELFGGAGTVPAVTVGGVDENGHDAVNDLTYLMLRATELLKTRDPSLNARYHYEVNSEEYRDRVAEVIAETRAVPAMHNDVVDIATLENQGVRRSHARDYAVIGCVELASAGRSYDASSSIMLNLVSVLELTLYDGKRPVTGDTQITPPTGDPAGFSSFADFWEAFKMQLAYVIEQAIDLNEKFGSVYQEILPSPLLSAFFEGPLEKGKDLIMGGALYNSSGATHIGFADAVDSLNAVEQAVFTDKQCDFAQLIQALEADFEGHEKLHAYLVNKTPKYGTANPVARKNARNLVKFLYDLYQSHENYRGGKYRPAYWTMTNHAGQGKLSGALPNGRKAGKVLASGITPVSQAAGELTTCLKEVGNLDSLCIPGGEALNMKFPQIRGPEDVKTLGQTVEAYFREGGLHVQFNIMSYEDLIEAKKDPDKHPDLLVRVSGYSAYFKDLNDAMKDEIITRSAYDVKTGKLVQFPKDHQDMLSTE